MTNFGPTLMAAIDLFTPNGMTAMGGVLAVLAAVWWYSAIYLRKKEDNGHYDRPGKLFRDLCDEHGLSRREVTLLRELADQAGLETPSLLFVRDDCFPPTNHAAISLRDKLFLSAEPAAPSTEQEESEIEEPTSAA
jgi:hypothetical protein